MYKVELDSLADAGIGAAPADVSRHGGIDRSIIWMWVFGEQRGCGHYLPALAVPALDHLKRQPSVLDAFAFDCRPDGLDGGYVAVQLANRHHARARWFTVDLYSARPTLADSASELGSS
ncbi:hypothetical protein LPU83_pLPU83d_1212 (plasmid) [Rhizobium favelukesii]|uniref:Uncharacterized protein n=1 Tax=Rhizobium favelukesii TaxID=348824 RepID=W6RNC1_9HYPH|nr:hypothetical protein LPU83_pLPU83d_1212 [Rhizobium favelukesii]